MSRDASESCALSAAFLLSLWNHLRYNLLKHNTCIFFFFKEIIIRSLTHRVLLPTVNPSMVYSIAPLHTLHPNFELIAISAEAQRKDLCHWMNSCCPPNKSLRHWWIWSHHITFSQEAPEKGEEVGEKWEGHEYNISFPPRSLAASLWEEENSM